MESSLDKCTTAVFKHGKPTKAKTVITSKPDSNKEQGAWWDLKYLDREESDGIENSQMKDKLVANITVGSGKFSRWSKIQTRKMIKKQESF